MTRLSPDNCITILDQYARRLYSVQPVYIELQPVASATVPTPLFAYQACLNIEDQSIIGTGDYHTKKKAAKAEAAFRLCETLEQMGEFDEFLIDFNQKGDYDFSRKSEKNRNQQRLQSVDVRTSYDQSFVKAGAIYDGQPINPNVKHDDGNFDNVPHSRSASLPYNQSREHPSNNANSDPKYRSNDFQDNNNEYQSNFRSDYQSQPPRTLITAVRLPYMPPQTNHQTQYPSQSQQPQYQHQQQHQQSEPPLYYNDPNPYIPHQQYQAQLPSSHQPQSYNQEFYTSNENVHRVLKRSRDPYESSQSVERPIDQPPKRPRYVESGDGSSNPVLVTVTPDEMDEIVDFLERQLRSAPDQTMLLSDMGNHLNLHPQISRIHGKPKPKTLIKIHSQFRMVQLGMGKEAIQLVEPRANESTETGSETLTE